MHKELKERAIKLRLDKSLSYQAILKEIPVAKSTLSVWLRPFPLDKSRILELRRIAWKKSEAKIEMFREAMRAKREGKDKEIYIKYLNEFKEISRESFFTSGLMLYLAEGGKTDLYNLSLTNTDVRVIKFFIKWLITFFDVPRAKLRVHLHLYENMEIEKETKFWREELDFDSNQFYKSYITKNKKSSFTYRESFRHGTCSIRVSGSDLKRRVMMAIKAYVDSVMAV